jgi:hypothetical protein
MKPAMWMWMIGTTLMAMAGCGASRVTHTLDANDPVDIPAGGCVLVAGASIPGGATTSYSVFDDNADDMDIAVVDSSLGCDPTVADTAYTSGVGSVNARDTIPASSNYNLVISCFNVVETCIPTVDDWNWYD